MLPFERYLEGLVHDWSKTVTVLVFSLVPLFFILDWLIMPPSVLGRFALYRGAATAIALLQYIILLRTSPSRFSYIHGYAVSLVVGTAITLMTVDLGGFDSRYYAGLNLVIIGVNILLPWRALHSAANGTLIVLLYSAANFFFGGPFEISNLVSNLFFMCSTVIIALSINYMRHRLIRKEYLLRSRLKKAGDALWSEMEIAKKIQTTLLPNVSRIGNFAVAAKMIPAREVGGDFYDIIETRSGGRWIAIGDVSGHGVEAGLVMMMTQTGIYSLVSNSHKPGPVHLIGQVNTVLRRCMSRLGSSLYTTMLVMRLDGSRLRVAGKHQDVIVYRSKKKSVEAIPTRGTWIGIADRIRTYFTELSITMRMGDVVVLFTDGLTEAVDSRGEMYGKERLLSAVCRHAQDDASEIVRSIIDEVVLFQEKQDDDITLLALKRVK